MALRDIVHLYKSNGNYKFLFLAIQISLFGDWFNFVAVTDILFRISNSTAVIAYIFIFHLLPFVFFTPLAGVLADKVSRQRLMMLSDLTRFFIVLLYFPMIYLESAAGILTLLFAQYSLAAFFEPARSAIVPDVVEKRDLFPANAGLAAGWSMMMALGMSLGGFVVYLSSPETALALDALTYLASYFFLKRIRITETHLKLKKAVRWRELVKLDDYKASFRYLKQEMHMVPIVLSKAALEVGTGGFIFLLTLFGETQFKFLGSAALSVGLLQAARGIGTGLGPFLARFLFRGQKREYYTLWFWLLVIPVAYFFVGMQSSIWLALLFVLLAHCGGGANWVISENLIHQLVPNDIRGRVISFEYLTMTLVMTISIKGASLLIDRGIATQNETLHYYVIAGIVTALFWGILTLFFGRQKTW